MMERQRHAKDIAHPMYDIIDNALSAVDGCVIKHYTVKHITVYTYCGLTGLSSWMLTRTAKLVRCVVIQVTDILLDWLSSTVNPSVDQPPIWLLHQH